MPTRKTIPADAIADALRRLAKAIGERHRETSAVVLLGIARGGVELCQRLVALLTQQWQRPVPEGVINVSFHRDDLGRNPLPSFTAVTDIPMDLEGATVVLIDDVLFSGRTIRAALEEVFSHGRPTRVELAVLVDRGNHRLPLRADYVGFTEETTISELVKVTLDGNDPSRDVVEICAPAT